MICLLFPTIAIHAEITGTVLDSLSNEPISGAIIKPIGYGNSTISDKSGKFKLNLPKYQVELSVNHPDYAEKFIRIKDNLNIMIYLSESGARTDEIEITAERHEHFDLNKIIDGKRLESQKSITLAETISELPGISMRSMGPVTARPVIRGMGSYRVSINENGLPVNDLSATSPDHAVTANTGNAEKIQLLIGPEMLEYSSSLSGGAINIESPYTNTDQIDEMIFDFKTGFETAANSKIVNSGLVIPWKEFSVGAAGNYSNSGNINSPERSLANTNSEFYDGKTFLSFSGKKFKILINGSLINSDYGIPGDFVGAHPNGVDIKMHQNNAQIIAKYNINNIADNVEIKYKRSYYNHKEYESSGLIGAEFVTRDNSSNINFDLSNNSFFDLGKLGMDLNYREHRYGGYVFTSPADELVLAPYAILSKDIKRWHLRFGIRYENRDFTPDEESLENIGLVRNRDFNIFSYSADISYDLFNDLNIGFTFSNSERAPTVDELYKEGPHLAAYSYETGNPDLSKEHSLAYEIYVNLTKARSKFSTSAYLYDFSSFITPRNSGDTNWATLLPIFATTEVPALMAGFDFGLDHNLWRRFWLRSTLSYVYGEITDENSPLPMIPPFKGLVALEYRSQVFNFGLKSEFSSSQLRTDLFEEPTDDYVVFGIDANYNFLYHGLYNSLYFSIDNIFNTIYFNHLSRIKSIFPEAGINIRLSYKLLI